MSSKDFLRDSGSILHGGPDKVDPGQNIVRKSFTIEFQPPPQAHLLNYNRLVPAAQQAAQIPPTFLSALRAREKVFVQEQGIPVEHHIDTDDARSYHWVIFPSSSNKELGIEPRGLEEAIGTLRLLTFPHYSLHPLPNSKVYVPSNLFGIAPAPAKDVFFASPPVFAQDRATSFHDGLEPYIKLGRLCVVDGWRGKGCADLLISEALNWAIENPGLVVEGESDETDDMRWKGLVCVHAQEGAGVRSWERNGFAVDEQMGVWWEADVKHYGMWKRVKVRDEENISRG